MIKNFNLLPILLDFSDLRIGDKVYSRRFGLGKFLRLHLNEAVIEFFDRKIRIAPDEQDISLILKYSCKRGRNEMSGEVAGNKVSFRKMKQMMAQDVAENFVSTKNAKYILDKDQKQFINLCDKYDIEITKFGIKKEDLLKLNKILFQ